MIPSLRLAHAPKNSEVYTPSRRATIAAGQSATLIYTGITNQQFAFDRILPSSTGNDKILMTVKINNDLTLFENVHLEAVRRLFLHRGTKFPLVVERNNTLKITLTNIDSVSHTASVMLTAYDEHYLRALRAAYVKKGMEEPKPVFLSAYDSNIPALTSNRKVAVELRRDNVAFYSIAVCSDRESDLVLTLNRWNDEIKSDVSVQQITDEFGSLNSPTPYFLADSKPLYWYVDNESAVNAATFSFLADGYVV